MDVAAGKGGSAILLMLPRDFSSQVVEWGQKNIPADRLSGLPNKGYDKSPHITLATGITDEEPEKAFKLLEKQEPFKVNLGDVDCFRKHEKGYDVIKINVVSPILDELNAGVLGNLEVYDPILPYSPHITLAYVKPFSCEDLIGNKAFKGMDVPVEGYVYSDREKGGKVVKFKQGGPLKESLDYSMAEVSVYLGKEGLSLGCMSSVDVAKTIMRMRYDKN